VILRDVKPENFVFGAHLPPLYNDGVKPTCKQVFEDYWCTNDPKLYAIDFGLTCYWRDPHTGVAYSDSKKHIRDKTGTARYASIQVHRGNLPSRRDDLESIGYILLDLVLGGRLPWAGVHAKNSKAGWDKVWRVKVDTPLSELCAGLPQAVVDFIAYTRSLRFMDQPDYDRLRGFLHAAAAGPDHYNQPDQIVTNPPPLSNEMDDDHYELFAMDDMKHHLPTVPEVPKKVGWNTHKRLDMADWTND
jgi:serine/threonine protein kinase